MELNTVDETSLVMGQYAISILEAMPPKHIASCLALILASSELCRAEVTKKGETPLNMAAGFRKLMNISNEVLASSAFLTTATMNAAARLSKVPEGEEYDEVPNKLLRQRAKPKRPC